MVLPPRIRRVQQVLDDLMELEDVYACMLVRRGMEGVFPTKGFKPGVVGIWDALRKAMDSFFGVIEKFSEAGLSEVYFTLRGYEVMFYVLPGLDTALVAIIPTLANKGLLEVEMENARREIIRVLSLREEKLEEFIRGL